MEVRPKCMLSVGEQYIHIHAPITTWIHSCQNELISKLIQGLWNQLSCQFNYKEEPPNWKLFQGFMLDEWGVHMHEFPPPLPLHHTIAWHWLLLWTRYMYDILMSRVCLWVTERLVQNLSIFLRRDHDVRHSTNCNVATSSSIVSLCEVLICCHIDGVVKRQLWASSTNSRRRGVTGSSCLGKDEWNLGSRFDVIDYHHIMCTCIQCDWEEWPSEVRQIVSVSRSKHHEMQQQNHHRSHHHRQPEGNISSITSSLLLWKWCWWIFLW